MINAVAIRSRLRRFGRNWTNGRGGFMLPAKLALSGYGGVAAVSAATGIARSTIDRGLVELRCGQAAASPRVRRPGGGRRQKIETEPGLLETLSGLVQSAIRGDLEAALFWVSKSQPHLAAALTDLIALQTDRVAWANALRCSARPPPLKPRKLIVDLDLTDLVDIEPPHGSGSD